MPSFIREIQVAIGPLKEGQSGSSQAQALVLNTTGRADEFAIAFRCIKSLSLTLSTIDFYNLSLDTRKTLATTGLEVVLQAGYKAGGASFQSLTNGTITTISGTEPDVPLQSLSRGAVTGVVSVREGPTIKTSVSIVDGAVGLSSGTYARSYRGIQEISDIVRDMAKTIKGVDVDKIRVEVSAKTGRKGMTLVGKVENLLNDLARWFGFTWSIRDRVFYAIDDDKSSQKVFNIDSKSGSLMHVGPLIKNVLQVNTGVEIETLLNPAINPRDIVNVTSTVSPELDGRYFVNSIQHIGDIRGNVWNSSIVATIGAPT